ncbi:NADH dehydrogenase [ubiquinone] 1 beta subcomplex subunit 10-like [Paramacrobiotus metropolitanus]|uniref:NADH dehydrogenase [ubiquinone] 1 beta subcomplex subunit 10-like n=1 Tax=Paramacrobiotus metropolitanus TaxID=2943436 RepID=UPI002445BE3D|nr:NADH dehydrogenase [ubiquinone] 1 beta subcomplex subunit 10-like [Paramacrobiotus metropolitanus]XP_055338175.1 NADH dehydrogenase [ubiquinone] 1 beta subcomplex subunit 10-like [Paramacrobiotus metropolitanus]
MNIGGGHSGGEGPLLKKWGVPRPLLPNDSPPENAFQHVRKFLFNLFEVPVTWFNDNVLEPNRGPKQVYYHRKFARVANIDECHEGDFLCYFEANEQYKRDRTVDDKILTILRRRKENCMLYEGHDWALACHKVTEDFEQALTNFFLRYGEVGYNSSVIEPYMKQKHRMIWERRNPDKVDFMYARNRKEYYLPIERGFNDSVQLPDNSRTRHLRGIENHHPESPCIDNERV